MPGPTILVEMTSVLPGISGVGPSSAMAAEMFDSVTNGITATASGTQTTALELVSKANNIATVTTSADAVRLPPAVAGLSIKVRNGATNSADVFPASAAQGGVSGGDTINALSANAAYTLATGTVTFTCYATGQWYTV